MYYNACNICLLSHHLQTPMHHPNDNVRWLLFSDIDHMKLKGWCYSHHHIKAIITLYNKVAYELCPSESGM